MKPIWWALAVLTASTATSADAQVKGAGSTFASNLYASWSQNGVVTKGSRLAYEPTGSGNGIRAVQERAVDFGASDKPLNRASLDQAGLVQFPTAIGGVVLLANVPGVPASKLQLDGPTLADIFDGHIKSWNAPAIKALNPELNLPATAITPVYRSEASGTSYVFTTYLSKVSAPFRQAIGATASLSLPGGKGMHTSTEIASAVHAQIGAIGYVDYSFANDLHLPMVQLKNQWGTVVSASPESMQLSMRAADWEKLQIDQDPVFDMDLTDAGCPGCWPITNLTYVLVPIKGHIGNSAEVLKFFEHAILHGDVAAEKEGYVPLPSRAKSAISLAMRRWNLTLERSGAGAAQRHSANPVVAAEI